MPGMRGLLLNLPGLMSGVGDRIAPLPEIASTAPATVTGPFSATITFKDGAEGDPEDVTGFVVAGITAGNCTLSDFTAVSGSEYTVTVIPTTNGNVTLDIAAGVCADAAGNLNTASAQFSRVLDLWWLEGGINSANVVAIYKPYGAASLAASYANIANPGTNDVTVGAAPTFAAESGWTFNGVDQYLVTPSVNHNTATVLVKFSDGPASGNMYLFGNKIGSNVFNVRPFGAANRITWAIGNYNNNVVPSLSSGVLAAGARPYRNGVAETADAVVFANQAGVLYLGGANVDGSLSGPITAKVQAVAIYNAKLSDAQVAAVSAEMANFT